MKFTITCTDGTVLNGDTMVDQDFEIDPNGVLTFFDAPDGGYRQALALSPAAWSRVSYPKSMHID